MSPSYFVYAKAIFVWKQTGWSFVTIFRPLVGEPLGFPSYVACNCTVHFGKLFGHSFCPKHIESELKWSPFCWWHFQIDLLHENFDSNSIAISCHVPSIGSNNGLTPVCCRGPVSLTVFHRNSNSMEISFHSHLDSNTVIATKFCTWHDSCRGMCKNLLRSNGQ